MPPIYLEGGMKIIILANFILSSENASNFDQSGVLSFGKKLKS